MFRLGFGIQVLAHQDLLPLLAPGERVSQNDKLTGVSTGVVTTGVVTTGLTIRATTGVTMTMKVEEFLLIPQDVLTGI